VPPENFSFEFDGIIDGVLIEEDVIVYSGSSDFIFNFNFNFRDDFTECGDNNIIIQQVQLSLVVLVI
jgi:hypothetical protein